MESYSIKRIKSFKDAVEIQLKPITVFVGKNSCGKSSLIRFPVVLSQTVSGDRMGVLNLIGKSIDYGNFEEVVFDHQTGPIEFSATMKMDVTLSDMFYTYKKTNLNGHLPIYKDVKILVEINKINNRLVIVKNEYFIDNLLCYGLYLDNNEYIAKVYHTYDVERDDLVQSEYKINFDDLRTSNFFMLANTTKIPECVFGAFFPNHNPDNLIIKTPEEELNFWLRTYNMDELYQFIDCDEMEVFTKDSKEHIDVTRFKESLLAITAYQYYTELILRYQMVFSTEIGYAVSYIGPFRNNPERYYRDEGIKLTQVGTKGEHISTVLIRDYQKTDVLITKISAWLKRTMGYQLVVEEIGEGTYKLLLENEKGMRSNIMDVGYGVSQILPILVQVLMDNNYDDLIFDYDLKDLIIVEQPELHLHPAAQSELADLFAIGALDCKKKILIETHSEHLIRKLQVLISDPNCKLTNEDVAVYYVDKDEEGGCALVKELKIFPNGKFAEKWPSGFFDKAHELSMELLRNQ